MSRFRNFNRFKAVGCVLVDLNSDFLNLGEVRDVSLGGLGVRYLDVGHAIPQSGKLQLFLPTHGLTLTHIPFQTVWNRQTLYDLPNETVTTTRYGIQFGNLMPSQQRAVRCLIQRYTTADPEM